MLIHKKNNKETLINIKKQL